MKETLTLIYTCLLLFACSGLDRVSARNSSVGGQAWGVYWWHSRTQRGSSFVSCHLRSQALSPTFTVATTQVSKRCREEYQCIPVWVNPKSIVTKHNNFANGKLGASTKPPYRYILVSSSMTFFINLVGLLWSLFHYQKPSISYDESDYRAYRQINQLFAQVLLKVCLQTARSFIPLFKVEIYNPTGSISCFIFLTFSVFICLQPECWYPARRYDMGAWVPSHPGSPLSSFESPLFFSYGLLLAHTFSFVWDI